MDREIRKKVIENGISRGSAVFGVRRVNLLSLFLSRRVDFEGKGRCLRRRAPSFRAQTRKERRKTDGTILKRLSHRLGGLPRVFGLSFRAYAEKGSRETERPDIFSSELYRTPRMFGCRRPLRILCDGVLDFPVSALVRRNIRILGCRFRSTVFSRSENTRFVGFSAPEIR